MKKRNVLIFLILLIIFGCSNSTYKRTYSNLNDGKYDNGFPVKDGSQYIEEISNTIEKIHSYLEYDLYTFSFEHHLIASDFTANSSYDNLRPNDSFVDASFGTATRIYTDHEHQVLLTCAHVLDFKDTIYRYFDELDTNGDRVIAEIAIKKKQQFFLKDGNSINHLDILAMERTTDIALLSGKADKTPNNQSEQINYVIGNSHELNWGDFVYIMGYPSGVQMLTNGIVSKSTGNKDVFMIDANFNKGFSGGIVLAVRDGIPNFEIVGIVQSASATHKNILIPTDNIHKRINTLTEQYEGELFVDVDKRINYGITYATSVEAVKDFYENNRANLIKLGYDLDSFFNH